MMKIGQKTYPDHVDAIMRDKKLVSVLYNFLKSELSDENLVFLMCPFKPKIIYRDFLWRKGKTPVNVKGSVFTRADALADKEDWRHPDWVEIIADAKVDCRKNINADSLTRFWSSEIFLKHHEANGGKRDDEADIIPDPQPGPIWEEAAEHFQMKNVAALKALINSVEKNGIDKTLTPATKVLRSEGKKMNSYIFLKLLVSEGFAREPEVPEPPVQENTEVEELEEAIEGEFIVELNKKKLFICGFTKLKTNTEMDRVRQMIEAYLRQDRQEAIKRYELILKKEAKDCILHNMSFVSLVKNLKKHKAFTVIQPEATG